MGTAAEEGELELSCKVLGSGPVTSRERIRRDRELHRLGLNLVERISKDVLIDLVQVISLLAGRRRGPGFGGVSAYQLLVDHN